MPKWNSGKMAETTEGLIALKMCFLHSGRGGFGQERKIERKREWEMARRGREQETRGDAVGGTSILRRRGALRLSGDNGVDGCESSHDPPVLPPRRSRRRGEFPFSALPLFLSLSLSSIAGIYYRTSLSSLATSRDREQRGR